MSMPIEYKNLRIQNSIESCRIYLDRVTGELFLIPTKLFEEMSNVQMEELLSSFPSWWITEIMPIARCIYEDHTGRFIEVSQSIAS